METGTSLPPHIKALFVAFFVANLTHFVHNAEYIGAYPGLPAGLTRDTVYLAWLPGAIIGLAGLRATRPRLRPWGVALVAVYGALGIDGLAHYTLALCSEHTAMTHLTIACEVVTGMALFVASVRWMGRHLTARRRHRTAV